jgi:3-methyladenine DNA glycosylase AlkC
MAAPLKDKVDRAVVEDLASSVVEVEPDFDAEAFVADLVPVLDDLEFKARIEVIARRLGAGLSEDYRAALDTVVAVARAEPPLDGFAAWALCTFVEVFGVKDPEASLPAMEHLTKRASCEFAVRPFLKHHWEIAQAQLELFTGNNHEAVRRLPSEGSRPRLPWGMGVPRLIEHPEPGLALLDRLRHDRSPTVRRSVANHLNDVARDHPDLVLDLARRWASEDPPVDAAMISHGLRTLVKTGHAEALEILGFTTRAEVEVLEFTVAPEAVGMGDHIQLDASLRSTGSSSQRLVIDFVIHHVNASGATSPKVFKWTKLDLAPDETVMMRKRRLIQQASTRTYRPGSHRVELKVAGTVVAEAAFDVDV